MNYLIAIMAGLGDGTCFSQSEDADRWVNKMQRAGFSVQIRDRGEVKAILFTYIEQPVAVLEA